MSAPGPPGRGLLFAESQLRRHGWRRGQGLGRQEHGIAEPIRVKVKCGTAGVGHDASEPFSFHWWDHVFNQAAANITVDAGQDGISVKALSEQGVRISNKKPRKAGSTPSLLYGRFVKSATLTAHGEEPTGSASSEEEEELDLSSARRLTDEELMRVCGGRTAHKGARHGLTMSAKLARLEEQERAFLATYGHKEPPERQGKKRKREESRDGASAKVLQRQELSEEEEGDEGKDVKRRKKKKQEPNGEEEVAGEEGKAAKRKKKKQQQQEYKEEPIVMKKKKKQKENKEEPIVMKKKKKKKQQDKEPAQTEMPLEGTDGPDQARHSPRKKKKRRRKKDPE
ncbi:G patch domain-containing protein 4 [Melopsittacus undulatus]|uniref:G patch domain-containing protein 4 n=1 Tax=Melopsittacus undulatus TaxID=13146 RepID=UPI00146C503A|nr:G patch domain-containing protein 4 [Melopsittacus undulatus]